MNIAKLKSSLQKKGWYFCFQEAWKRIWPIRWVRDIEVMDQLYERRAYRFLKRRYQSRLAQFVPEKPVLQQPARIWVCWLQGEDNAPELVKRCIRSIREHAGGMEVMVVTNENLPTLVDIPTYITDKLKKKKMQFATYSDYIRLALLTKYGGVWIDATVLMTDAIPGSLLEQSLFCFKKSYLSTSCIAASSWFIIAQPGNTILQQVKYLFECYWRKESHLCNYYLFHLLFALVVDANEENRLLWSHVPYIHNVDVHTLQYELFEPYSRQRFETITQNAFVHKLTYKFSDASLCSVPGTNYQFVVNASCD